MEDGLGRRIMKKFAALKPKMYSYLTNDSCVVKKAKGTRKCAVKRTLKFDILERLENNKTVLKAQQRFRRKAHNAFTEKVSKILLSVNGCKKIQTFNQAISFIWHRCW